MKKIAVLVLALTGMVYATIPAEAAPPKPAPTVIPTKTATPQPFAAPLVTNWMASVPGFQIILRRW